MTLDQLTTFANSKPDHIRQISLTREAARQLLAEIEAKDESPKPFDVVEHMLVPSRDRPLASAAAVNMRRERSVL